MWTSIINDLQREDSVDSSLPIRCNQHPDDIRYISKPGDLPRVSPDGKR